MVRRHVRLVDDDWVLETEGVDVPKVLPYTGVLKAKAASAESAPGCQVKTSVQARHVRARKEPGSKCM
ncbi:hypothetical protein Tdes44962_MAKER06025 [Teratosphaeria destructans]|uniref:Uncharacterized protein n=1 Tax=Teratosphaeria destructans TaxID=418781 RepID=A0A9W7SJ16_9PEZI|nr:hypothetical protein Tdes44962_MAKER06025 [Teratosphaeria destructans]